MHKSLYNWYNINKRDLPWRNTKDPFKIWLSEIILQQTRVEQGLPYYIKFTQNFKNINEFANANLNDILKLWQGLGYYSRARNMHYTAQFIRDNLNGVFPNSYSELIILKGIGPYTAAAIASFSNNEKKAVVDGNVFRVLARLTGTYTDTNSNSGKNEFSKIAEDFLIENNAAIHNQAMMELGALICKPLNPDCYNCPLQNNCFAFENNEQKNLPIKIKKVKNKTRLFNYFIFEYNNTTYITQRGPNDIWEGLFEFPLLENILLENENDVFNYLIENKIFDKKAKLNINFIVKYKHILTHQTLNASFWKITCSLKPKLAANYIEVPISEIKKYAVPRLLEKLITNDKLQHQIF